MKKIFILLVLVSNLSFAQSKEAWKDNIKKDFLEFSNSLIKRDFEKFTDYIPPEIFKIVPKNQMILAIKQMYSNPDMEFKPDMPTDIKYLKPIKIDNKFYSEITYTNNIKIKFNGTNKSNDEETNKLQTKLIKKMLGSDNVTYNKETGFFEIHSINKAFGISKDGISGWKFMGVDKNQMSIMEKILPKELIEKL